MPRVLPPSFSFVLPEPWHAHHILAKANPRSAPAPRTATELASARLARLAQVFFLVGACVHFFSSFLYWKVGRAQEEVRSRRPARAAPCAAGQCPRFTRPPAGG